MICLPNSYTHHTNLLTHFFKPAPTSGLFTKLIHTSHTNLLSHFFKPAPTSGLFTKLHTHHTNLLAHFFQTSFHFWLVYQTSHTSHTNLLAHFFSNQLRLLVCLPNFTHITLTYSHTFFKPAFTSDLFTKLHTHHTLTYSHTFFQTSSDFWFVYQTSHTSH